MVIAQVLSDFVALSDAIEWIMAGFVAGAVVGMFAGFLRVWKRRT